MGARELIVRIGADISDFTRRMSEATSGMQSMGQKFQDSGRTIGSSFTGIGVVVGGALGLSVKKAADFEQEMANVRSVMDPADAKTYGAQLDKLAITMGSKTAFSATQAAQGMGELVKAGVSVHDIMNGGLEGALNLATAGDLSLAESAEIASGALNGFSKDGMTMADAANILAGAANASATDVHELKYALASVGSVASAAGLSFKDTNTALAVFAQNNLKGSDAGTSLKTMLLSLNPTSSSAANEMKKLGIITKDGSNQFYDAKGNLKSYAEIAGVLQKSLGGMTAQQRQAALETMFGTDGMRAAILTYQAGTKGVNDMSAAMSKIVAADVAKEKLNTLKGAIEQLKGGFETAQISIGTTFIPVLTTLAGWLGKVNDWFNGLSPGMQKFIAYGMAVTAGLFLLGGAVGFLVMGLGALMVAEWGVLLPVAAIVLGVMALVGVFILLWNKSEAFRKAVTDGWNMIKAVALKVWAEISKFFMAEWAKIKAFWDANGPQFMQAVTNVWNGIVAAVKFIWPVVLFVIMMVWDAIKGVIDGALNIIMGLIKIFSGLFTGDWGKMWEGIKQLLFGAVEFIWNWMNLMFIGRVLGGIKALAVGMFEHSTAAWKWVTDIFKGGIDAVINFVKGLVADVLNWFGHMKDQAGSIFRFLRGDGENIFSALWNTIRSVASNIWHDAVNAFNGMKSGVGNALNSLKGAAGDIWNSIKGTAESVWNGIKNAIEHPIQSAKDTVLRIIDTIKNAFANMHINLPHFDLPHVSVVAKTGALGIPYPDFNVQWHANGGVFNGASVVGLGEAGPEAIVPLSGSKMAPFAQAIASEMLKVVGGNNKNSSNDQPTEVHVLLDGRTIAKATVPYMDKELRNKRDSLNRARGGQ